MLLLLLGCGPDAIAWRTPASGITLTPETLEFSAVSPGDRAVLQIEATNTGDAAIALDVSTVAPFAVDRAVLDIGVGGSATLNVSFAPGGWSDVDGHVFLGEAVLPVVGHVLRDADADGAEARAAGGTDCDDTNPDVHPAATDSCGDDLDANCDPTDDDDCDGDNAPAAIDCDDADPARAPGQADDVDGVDQDCDGLVDEDALVAGDLVITELSPQDPAWIEVCSLASRPIPLDGLTVRTAAGTVALGTGTVEAGACAALCASTLSECAFTAELQLDPLDDTVVLAAGPTVVDAITIDAAWDWQAGWVWSLGQDSTSADANNAPAAWCRTTGSPGLPNGACG